jgi:hypothetical protein
MLGRDGLEHRSDCGEGEKLGSQTTTHLSFVAVDKLSEPNGESASLNVRLDQGLAASLEKEA